jgi:hypothetical protein
MKGRYRWLLRLAVFLAAAWWVGERLPAAPSVTLCLGREQLLGFNHDGLHFLSVQSDGGGGFTDRLGSLDYWSVADGRRTRSLFGEGALGPFNATIEVAADGRWAWLYGDDCEGRIIDLASGESTARRILVSKPNMIEPLGVQLPQIKANTGRGLIYRLGPSGVPEWPWRKNFLSATKLPADANLLERNSAGLGDGTVSSDGRFLLLLDKVEDLIIWDFDEQRIADRFPRADRKIMGASLSPDSAHVALVCGESPSGAQIVEIIRRRDGSRVHFGEGGVFEKFAGDGRCAIFAKWIGESGEHTMVEVWSTDDRRLIAKWKIRSAFPAGCGIPPTSDVHVPPNSPWLLRIGFRGDRGNWLAWLEEAPAFHWLPGWLVGSVPLSVVDSRTGLQSMTPACAPESSQFVGDTFGGETIFSPDGDQVAVVDSDQNVRIYAFPFRPAWWMRAIVGLVILLVAEVIARLFILVIRPFLPGRSSVEPAAATQKERRDISG